jgi:carboxylate-amine ligase
MNTGTAHKIARRRVAPLWARWNDELDARYTLGVEEEVMLLDAESLSLAQCGDEVLERLSEELRANTSPETHAAVLELTTGVQPDVDGVLDELRLLRFRLAEELNAMGLAAAAAGTHPLTVPTETEVSAAPRYRVLEASLRMLAHREPTMALHVHVGVPAPEDAVRVLNGLRRNLALLLALSANSPFLQGSDSGFASARTVVFQAFPRTGPPRRFSDYADYVGAVDALIASTAIPDPSFVWWDVRLQPTLGTVEVRVMDAQAELEDVAPLVALIQSLARLELEGEPSRATPSAEALAENRFLAARDGMDARLIDAGGRRLVPARDMLEVLVGECLPHAFALGCVGALERVFQLADRGGADRQRQIATHGGTLADVVSTLADRFLAPGMDRPTLDLPIVRRWTP